MTDRQHHAASLPNLFSQDRWDTVKENAERWWAGELKRPLIQMRLRGCDPGRPSPAVPRHKYLCAYEESTSPEDIVDAADYELRCTGYLGDAFPIVSLNYSVGQSSVLLGASPIAHDNTVWLENLPEAESLADLDFSQARDLSWHERQKAVYRAACERWQGQVQLPMPTFGGSLDIVADLRTTDTLLYDLYDDAEEVKRLNWEAHAMAKPFVEEINRIVATGCPGFSAWTTVFSASPFAMLQCDFSYMISPDMFEEFVLPEIVASCRHFPRTIFHVDGPGMLPHLDMLLAIDELDGIQWIPGAGQPWCQHWPEVYRKTRDAGKLIQLFGGFETLDGVAEALGSAEGIVFMTGANVEEGGAARAFLEKYQVPC